MIAHWPNGLKTKPGSVTDQPGHLVDFMATFIDLAGADYPSEVGVRNIDPLQGKSLLSIFAGETREPHEQLYFHFSSDRAIRQGPWKLVSAKLGKWELYNLDEDRTELNDLSKKHPERVAEMSSEWFRLAKDVERLGGKGLAPVGKRVKELNFRGTPAPGSSKKRPKKK
jgi:arylsulfatase